MAVNSAAALSFLSGREKHSLFVQSRWIWCRVVGSRGTGACSLFRDERKARTNGRSTRMEGPQVLLEPNVAQAIAVILHEFATNAAKYGALSVPNGQIDLKWLHEADGQLILRWTEMGSRCRKSAYHRDWASHLSIMRVGSALSLTTSGESGSRGWLHLIPPTSKSNGRRSLSTSISIASPANQHRRRAAGTTCGLVQILPSKTRIRRITTTRPSPPPP
jgi:hypothetical protein